MSEPDPVLERLIVVETQREEDRRILLSLHRAVYGCEKEGTPGILAELHAIRTGRNDMRWWIPTIIAAAAVVVAIVK